MNQYSIYSGHMPDLLKKIQRIKNKCNKFGCNFHFAKVGEELKEVKDLDGKIITCKFFIIEAEGTAVINGWQFIASVEHTDKGNIFLKAMTDIEIPERYRNSEPICEHCNSNRIRKNTFIIMNIDNGDFKQVGKSCLMDYTGGLSAATATWFASIKDVFEEFEEVPISCGYHERYFDTKIILQYTAETIRHFGYSKSDNIGTSTKDMMEKFLMVDMGYTRWIPSKMIEEIKELQKKVRFNPESDEAKKMVEEVLDWINKQNSDNDYIHNLKVATSLENTTSRRFGLLVSLFPTFNRNLELQEKIDQEAEQGKISEHIGKVGDRITVDVEEVKCITSWESCYDGYHNVTTYIWKITDKNGNVFTWKTSNLLNEEKPPELLKGTVKEHKEFRGVKQTELTRVRI